VTVINIRLADTDDDAVGFFIPTITGLAWRGIPSWIDLAAVMIIVPLLLLLLLLLLLKCVLR
jgi:hypothetical protein